MKLISSYVSLGKMANECMKDAVSLDARTSIQEKNMLEPSSDVSALLIEAKSDRGACCCNWSGALSVVCDTSFQEAGKHETMQRLRVLAHASSRCKHVQACVPTSDGLRANAFSLAATVRISA